MKMDKHAMACTFTVNPFATSQGKEPPSGLRGEVSHKELLTITGDWLERKW